MTDDPHFEHDTLFKNVFEQRKNAASLLRMVLPAELVRRARWRTLRVESGELRPKPKRQLHTDLLFSVRVDSRKAFIYLLVEHQSSVEPRMVLRMLGYMIGIWQRHRLILLDLTTLDEQDLRRRALTDAARLALWLLKTARDNPNLAEDLERWLDVFRQVALAPDGVAAAAAFLNYATSVGEIDPDRVAHITGQLGPAVQEAYNGCSSRSPSTRSSDRRRQTKFRS